MKPFVCLLLLASVASCGPEAPLGTRPLHELKTPIVNGQPETNAAYETVGMIFVRQAGQSGGFLCSATLIAPNVALTAGHCTTDDQNNQLDFASGAYTGDYYFGANIFAGTIDAKIPIRALVKFPAYTGPPNFKNDIGIVILARDVVAEGFKPFPYARAHVAALDTGGVSLHFVGYGITSTHADDAGVRRSTDIPVPVPNTGVCSGVGYDSRYQFCDGDGLHATCSGDSGGPALLSLNGVQTIVGVTSFGSASSCLAYGVDTRVDAYQNFIDFQVQNAPKAENCSNGINDDGTGLIDCANPACADSPVCSPSGAGPRGQCQACSATALCAPGLQCVKELHSSSQGICQALCGSTTATACGAGQTCASYATGELACSCGMPPGAQGEGCYGGHPCGAGLVCSAAGTCRAPCGAGLSCASGFQCQGTTCEPIPATSTTGSHPSTTTSGSSSGSGKSGGCGAAGGAGLSLLALLGAALLVRRRD